MDDENNKKSEHPKAPKNFIFFQFPKIYFKFPPFISTKPEAHDPVVEEREKPDVVKFADPKPVTPPPLNLENEELEKLSHPSILFPAYALGGFIILKWVWARWKERTERAKKASSDDDQSDECQSPVDDHE